MKIEAHQIADEGEGCTERVQVGAIDRQRTWDPLGMSVTGGKALLLAAQRVLVNGRAKNVSCACTRRAVRCQTERQRMPPTPDQNGLGLVSVQSPRV